MADDQTSPAGRFRRHFSFARSFSLVSALLALVGALLLAAVVFVLVIDDPQGGQPVVVVPIQIAASQPDPGGERDIAMRPALGHSAERGVQPEEIVMPPADIIITQPGEMGRIHAADLIEPGVHGPLPVVAADGRRAAEFFAAELPRVAADAPRIAILIGGMGVSTTLTEDAIRRLPAAVTLAFAPYGDEIERLTTRARQAGHELMLQVPLEPFDYPDNDPGPQTLLTGLSEEQNRDKLHWAMSRMTGYVGVTNYMGGRFTSSEASLRPFLGELRERGLIFADDGASPQSITGQLAARMELPFAVADVIIDASPTREAIKAALAELEEVAHAQGSALGVASGLPAGVEEIAEWIPRLESKGLVLVPVTALVLDRDS